MVVYLHDSARSTMSAVLGDVLLIASFVSVYSTDVTIHTKVGTFVGFEDEITTFSGELFKLSKFLGIPYAEPPVGDLRFRKPVAKRPLSEPLEVKKFGSPCMQAMLLPKPLVGSEDCLFLNIYVPKDVPARQKLPVMLWIHGGGFVLGTSGSYVPDRLVASGPVIVVTINYRLSVWGFLSTGDPNFPGNYGLWDQHLAIRWVHDNIESFGGDPSRVTIFGESAGSASVLFQGLYKGNRGLFQRIIAQSGAPLSVLQNTRSPLQDVKDFADIAGCGGTEISAMMDCLRGLPSETINNTINNFANGLASKPAIFLPHVDYDFIEEKSVDIFNPDKKIAEASRSTMGSFDLLIGANSGEGALVTSYWDSKTQDSFLPNSTAFKDTLIPQFLSMYFGEISTSFKEAVFAEYTDWNDPENPETVRDRYLTLAGDIMFVEPACRTADIHARYSERPSSYLYYLTINPSSHAMPTTPSWANKPNHGDDIIYVFGGEGDFSDFGVSEKSDLQSWEKTASENVMTLWTNFAKTGNPNHPRDLGLNWVPYTQKDRHCLDIARTMTSQNLKKGFKTRIMNFWSKVVPAIRSGCKDGSGKDSDGTCSKEKDCSP